MHHRLEFLLESLATFLLRRGETLCTVESCTGGLIAKTLTDRAGSSVWFDRGYIPYSNQAKIEMLAVPPLIIERYGAVSEPVVNAMLGGALSHSGSNYAIAVTGIAGPGGGSQDKPVGTVWIGLGSSAEHSAHRYQFRGDREMVRALSLEAALQHFKQLIDGDR